MRLISDLLGVVDSGHLFDLADAVLKGQIQAVLEGIDAAWRQGYEMKRFYADLTGYFHHLSMIKLGGPAEQLIDLPAQQIEAMTAQVKTIPHSYLVQIVELLFQSEPAIKFSSQPRLGLEMIFMKLFQTPPALPIERLIEQLDRLQSKIGQGVSGPAVDGPADPPPQPAVDHMAPAGSVTPGDEEKRPAARKPSGDMNAVWEAATAQLAEQKPSLAGFLAQCSLRPIDDHRATLEVKGNAFTLKSVKKHMDYLERISSDIAGRPIELQIEANMEDAAARQEQKEMSGRLKQEAMSHPLLMEALDLFDGRVVDIKVP